jgi:hypothetical protein
VFAAAVGLRSWLRFFPAGRRLLDAPQLALLGRLRARISAIWRWETEVPIPIPGDLRAADARLSGPVTILVEAYTRLADFHPRGGPEASGPRSRPAAATHRRNQREPPGAAVGGRTGRRGVPRDDPRSLGSPCARPRPGWGCDRPALTLERLSRSCPGPPLSPHTTNGDAGVAGSPALSCDANGDQPRGGTEHRLPDPPSCFTDGGTA